MVVASCLVVAVPKVGKLAGGLARDWCSPACGSGEKQKGTKERMQQQQTWELPSSLVALMHSTAGVPDD